MATLGDGPLFNLTGTAAAPTKGKKRPREAIFDEHAKRFSATADSIRAVARASGSGGAEPEALRTQGELLVLELKRAARGLRECLCEGVGTAEQASEQADGVAVQLHGLAYEKGHLEREIAFERRFGSAHEQIVLPSAKDMPAAKGSASSTSSSSSEHQLMLELLAYELTLREQFVTEESALAEVRTALQGQVATKRTFLEVDLPAQLAGLCTAAKPLAAFKPSSDGAAEPANVARGSGSALPAPLFTLMSQFEAHRDEFAEGAMAVRVVADDAGAGATEEPQAKQRRTDGASRAAALEPFPMSVEVTHEASGKRGTLKLTFTYLPELEVITVDGEWKPAKGRKKLTGPDLLADLFEGDQGLELPNPASVHVLGSGTWSGGSGKAAGKARPYRWAQWLGGLYYPRPNNAAQEATANGVDGDAGQSWSVYETIQRILTAVE